MAQKKIASNFKNIVLCLLLIAAISASVLGIVYKSTKKSIEQSKEAKKENAIKQVLPDYTRLETEKIIAPISNDNKKTLNDDILKKELKADSITIHKAYKNEKLVGFAVETFTNKGYAGRFDLMVGFLPNGDIYQIAVLSHSETPGLGSKIADKKFYQQFEGKNPNNFVLKVKNDGGNIDAITAATISSRAYCDAVNKAYNTIKSMIGGENNE